MSIMDEITVTCESLINSNVEAVIDGCNEACQDYCQQFAKAYAKAKEDNAIEKSHAYQFLSSVCSLLLRSSNADSPFEPYAIVDSVKTVMPSDFTQNQCEVLGEVCAHIINPELAARVADLAWVTTNNFNAAKIAIKKYVESSNSTYCKDSWSSRIKRLERAIRIATKIKDNTSKESITILLLRHIDSDDELFDLRSVCSVLKILMDLNCLTRDTVAEKALFFANQIVDSHNNLIAFDFANSLYDLADRAYRKSNNHKLSQEMKYNIAKIYEKKAAIAGSHIVAASFIGNAITVLKDCKGQKEYVEILKRLHVEHNKSALTEMTRFSTAIDLSPLRTIIDNAMRDKTLIGALFIFAKIPVISIATLKEAVLERQKNCPLSGIAEKPYINKEGRVVATIPAIPDSNVEEYDFATNAGCYELAGFYYHSYTAGMILPALELFKNNHNITRKLLSTILQHSTFIPEARKNLWIKGLIAGFNGDFDIALHILIPQFEGGLRQTLERHGEIVWNTDENGIDSEMSLKQLLNLPKSIELLGEDICFNLKCLLMERTGFNIRNDMCHGLMEEQEFFSVHSIYAWWLLFCIIINSIDETINFEDFQHNFDIKESICS